MKNKNLSLISRAALAFIAVVILIGCIGPSLEVLSQQLKETTVQTEGEADYAYKYTVRVRNKGAEGKVRAIAELYTPEGQFYRDEIVYLKSDQEKVLEFIFNEPSVGGEILAGMAGETKVQYRFRYEAVE